MRFRRAVQAVIRSGISGRSGSLVLIVQKPDLKTKELKWRLLKGGVKKFERDWRALRREIKEEVGIRRVRIERKVHSYYYTDHWGTTHHVVSYLVWADPNEPIKTSSELTGAMWLHKSKALKKLEWPQEKASLKKAFGEMK